MMKFFKAFGPMILTIVGVVLMLSSFFFYENLNVLQSMLVFGLWFLFIPVLAWPKENDMSIRYRIRKKEYASAMLLSFLKIMMLVYCPLLAIFYLCKSAIVIWALLSSVGFAALALLAFIVIAFIEVIGSMYEDAIKKYRS